ncbi:Pkinase-domain-containing protein [Hortaea werneckii]|nr:Pkinase-domain-containing protein [Hortaea werneckii]
MTGNAATGDERRGKEEQTANTRRDEGSELPARQDSKVDGQHEGTSGRLQDASVTPQHPSTDEQVQARDAVTRNQDAFSRNAGQRPSAIDTAANPRQQPHQRADRSSRHVTPITAGLHIYTDVEGSLSTAAPARLKETPTIFETPVSTDAALHPSVTSPVPIPSVGGSGLRTTLSTASMASSYSAGSTLPSPYLAAMTDLTPLPSPLAGSDSPGPWRRAQLETPRRSRQSSLTAMDDATPTGNRTSSMPASPTSPPQRKKPYGSLVQEVTISNAAARDGNADLRTSSEPRGHGRNRSISDFVPEALNNIRPQRHVTFGPGNTQSFESQTQNQSMQREANLAERRGLVGTPAPVVDAGKGVPTPPASSSSLDEAEESHTLETPYLEDGSEAEYLEIHCGIHNKRRRFRQLRQLGQGTFSRVMLATLEKGLPAHPTPEIEDHLDPAKLVAVKIVEHGPAGGADEERIENGLKREVEMLKSVSHPSLIDLKACEYQPSRALLVLTYCPGGDLFELASAKRDILTSPMVQRMFAELVSAVKYLHENWIVHRDIKLENVLVNYTTDTLRLGLNGDPRRFSHPLVTLTDLGLSRRVPQPPESPLLTTRCGSEDYAAPEILLGQPMKIDGIEGLTVSVRVAGCDLQEYDDTTEEPSHLPRAIKYVEASTGSNFVIHTRIKRLGSRRLQSPWKGDSLGCDIFLDGRRTNSPVYRINEYKYDHSRDVDSATENHGGTFLRRLFQFADLTTNDGGAREWRDVQKMKSLGEIQIEFRWCRTGKVIPAEPSNPGVRYSGQNAIAEKCLKGRAISSQAILGAGTPCTEGHRIEATYPYGSRPFATYVFRYRSHRDLQIEGIIPRSPSPQPGVPLEERDPATLSVEEARKLVRILRERHGGRIQAKNELRPEIKHESVKRTSSQMAAVEDNDDLMVTGEGPSSKRMRRATDEVVDCIDLTDA